MMKKYKNMTLILSLSKLERHTLIKRLLAIWGNTSFNLRVYLRGLQELCIWLLKFCTKWKIRTWELKHWSLKLWLNWASLKQESFSSLHLIGIPIQSWLSITLPSSSLVFLANKRKWGHVFLISSVLGSHHISKCGWGIMLLDSVLPIKSSLSLNLANNSLLRRHLLRLFYARVVWWVLVSLILLKNRS